MSKIQNLISSDEVYPQSILSSNIIAPTKLSPQQKPASFASGSPTDDLHRPSSLSFMRSSKLNLPENHSISSFYSNRNPHYSRPPFDSDVYLSHNSIVRDQPVSIPSQGRKSQFNKEPANFSSSSFPNSPRTQSLNQNARYNNNDTSLHHANNLNQNTLSDSYSSKKSSLSNLRQHPYHAGSRQYSNYPESQINNDHNRTPSDSYHPRHPHQSRVSTHSRAELSSETLSNESYFQNENQYGRYSNYNHYNNYNNSQQLSSFDSKNKDQIPTTQNETPYLPQYNSNHPSSSPSSNNTHSPSTYRPLESKSLTKTNSPVVSLSSLKYSKQEMRLQRNRQAARECRLRKKKYVQSLEEKVSSLQQENSNLLNKIANLEHLLSQKK
ncbi:hypothetical protein BB560_002623 [Smittium megazygosporum]|uniref:BZIP domain-containing protein n=1 Tax=Smittium megazygosporum TaxID=133381 RepID=A0A2T9ZEE4_9FUNG|nr:hypothetical protein BB560_002623 [Smittium megazygosporum]